MRTRNHIILTLDQARITCEELRRQGKKTVLTNGCFDLLHAGHLACLEFAKAQGDVLIVAVNDDLSVRRLKGEGRPVIPGRMRLELLSGLKPVDYVVSFSADNAAAVIRLLQPDIYVKGGDYDASATPEGQEAVRYSGKSMTAPFLPGISTTYIINKICGTVLRKDGA